METLISEQEIIWKAAYRVGCTQNAGEGGLQESLAGLFLGDVSDPCNDQQSCAPPRRAWLCLLGTVSEVAV